MTWSAEGKFGTHQSAATGIRTYGETLAQVKNGWSFGRALILECATGADGVQVAKRIGSSEQTVWLWRGRFLQEGMRGLKDLARSGRPDRIKSALKGRILSEAVKAPSTLEGGVLDRWPNMASAQTRTATLAHICAPADDFECSMQLRPLGRVCKSSM